MDENSKFNRAAERCLLPRNIKAKLDVRLFENSGSRVVAGFGEDEWLTTEEAARFLKVSPFYLRNLTSNGLVPYQKLQRRNRYLKSDLVSLLFATRKGGLDGN